MKIENTIIKDRNCLKAFLLLFLNNTCDRLSKSGIDFVKSQMETGNFDELYCEYNKRNDIQIINMLLSSVETFDLSKSEIEALFGDAKSWFKSREKQNITGEYRFNLLSKLMA